MASLFSAFLPGGPQSQALHYSYEKAGLVFDNQPIPWNAESILVEALVRASNLQPRQRLEFSLHLPNQPPIPPELLRPEPTQTQSRLFFRLPVPEQTTLAHLFWKERSLGQLTLPILTVEEFLRNLMLQHASAQVHLGEATVACQSFVTTQAQSAITSALLTSPTSLIPILDLGLSVELGQFDQPMQRLPVRLSSSQMRARQALLAVLLPRPRKTGPWQVRWLLGERCLASLTLKGITKRHLLKSLRISSTRFFVQNDNGEVNILRFPPTSLEGIHRLGPCFLVCSSEPGLAGFCDLSVKVVMENRSASYELVPQSVYLSDGPSPYAPGTFAADDLANIRAFELYAEKQLLGTVSLAPVPIAEFNPEGGFQTSTEEFPWSPAAEEQLNDRLRKLLGG